MREHLKKIFPAAFLLILWMFFSYPYFFQGKVPFPSTYQVNHFQPWSLEQKYWGPVKNGAMPDIIDQIYPWRHFTIEEYKKGTIPWWNPNSFSGTPNIANVQTAAFNPLNILFTMIPFIDAWSIIVLVQPLIAGLGMLLFLRSQAVSRRGAVLGSIAWMFCGFITVWMAYATLSLAISYLPLALYLMTKFIVTKKYRWGLLLSLSITSSFFSGHFQTSLYFLFVVFFYGVFFGTQEKRRIQVLLGFFLVLGLLFSLLQILPAIQFYFLSPRSSIFLFSGGIPFQYLVTLLSPDFYGNPVTRNDWFGAYAEWASFVGVVPLIFSLFSIVRRNHKLVVIFFQVLFVFAVLFAVNSPLLGVLGILHIPVLSTSTPSRLIVLASFSIAVLSAFGFDVFVEKLRSEKLVKVLVPPIFLGLVILCIWLSLSVFGLLNTEYRLIAQKNLLLPTALTLFVFIVIFSAYYLRKRTKILFLLLCAPVLLASFDSLRYVTKWMPFDPRSDVYPNARIVTEMKKSIGGGRVFGNLGAQVGTYYDLPIIEGYDPLFIDRYGEFIRTSATGAYTPSERSVVKLDRNGKYTKRVLDLLDVTLIYHPVPDTNQTWAFPVWSDDNYKLLYNDRLFSLYKNTQAIPRPTIFFTYQVVPDSRELLQAFYSDRFPYRTTLLLEEDPHMQKPTNDATASVTIRQETANELIYDVDSSSSGLLFLSDNFYPGWHAFVNAREAKIYRADYTFRAVMIPQGKSRVSFRYQGLF